MVAEGLSNPFEVVMRAAIETQEPSAKRLKQSSPMKGLCSVLLGSSGSRRPLGLQESLSELCLPRLREMQGLASGCLSASTLLSGVCC